MSIMQTQTGVLSLNSTHSSATDPEDTSTFSSVDFPAPFPAGSKIIVIPMVQTFNGPDTPGIRITDVTTTGFKIRLNELVDQLHSAISDGVHYAETIGWVAYTV